MRNLGSQTGQGFIGERRYGWLLRNEAAPPEQLYLAFDRPGWEWKKGRGEHRRQLLGW